tara:strand:+ start:322 stop:522 length:201 start_codon:yes stop_codon:yes gene_type:complete
MMIGEFTAFQLMDTTIESIKKHEKQTCVKKAFKCIVNNCLDECIDQSCGRCIEKHCYKNFLSCLKK